MMLAPASLFSNSGNEGVSSIADDLDISFDGVQAGKETSRHTALLKRSLKQELANRLEAVKKIDDERGRTLNLFLMSSRHRHAVASL